jgi:outer membrane autotransporter protein
MMGTALTAIVGLGYGRGAYAQGVTPSGALSQTNATTVEITGPGTFTTEDGFSVDASGSREDGITITTSVDGDTAFTDGFASSITGSKSGIYAYNGGSGALSITTTGTVTGTSGDGIRAYSSTAGNLTIIANTVTGSSDGIDAQHYGDGDGDLLITTNGTVTGQDGAAIETYHDGTGNLSVTTYGALVAQRGRTGNGPKGIWATHHGDGDLTVTSNGAIDATAGDDGIDTDQSGTGDQIIVVNGDITANAECVNADHDGTGLFSITVNGDIDVDDDGIDADRGLDDGPAQGDMVLVVTGTVTAGGDAIHIDHEGDGDIDITVSGDLVADSDGIKLDHDGEGAIDIDVTGTITADEDIGVDIDHEGNGDITIAVNDLDADADGVQVDHSGDGALDITVNGILGSATGDAIEATIAGEDGITIVIAADGHVQTSGTDTAIQAEAPNGAVDVTNAGTITGAVDLSNSNVLRNTGTWSLAGTTSDFNATGDSLVQNAGLIVAAQDAAAGETSVIDNLDTFRNQTGGTIRLADGATGDVFRIATTGSGTGDFVANGGTVEMDVVLDGDGSATDLLDISGDVILDTVPTALSFTPVGGGNASTVAGIEVVRVGGTSDAGAFTLASPVEFGALAYDLSLGDCAGQADNSWYLCTMGVSASGAVFEAMPGIILGHFARAEGRNQQLGSRITSRAVTASSRGTADTVDGAARRAVGPWLRSWGSRADVTPTTSSGGTSWEASSLGIQFGIAAALGDTAGGDLIGGLSFELNSLTADIENANGTGRVDMDGHGIGLSLTWFGHGGCYVDLTAARDWIDVDASSTTDSVLLDRHDEVVTSASAEIGQRFVLDDATALVPQMQLSWSQMQGGSFTDAIGNSVTIANRETLTARLGVALERDVALSDAGTGKLYGFGNLLADLSGDQTVTVEGTDLSQGGRGNWAELGAGFSMSPDGESNLFGEIAYRSAFADVEGHAMSASLGWRVQW